MTRSLAAVPALITIVVVAIAAAACGRSEAPRATTQNQAQAASDMASSADSAAPTPRAGSAPRIVFLGDSLTAGYGIEKSQAVPALIQERLRNAGYPYEVVNAGVSGDTSAGGLNRLDWSLEGDVRVLVIELGANDGLRGLPIAQLRSNLDTIIRRAKMRGIDVVLTGMEAPPNFGAAYTAEFRRVYRELAREHDVAFVPFYLQGVAGIPSLNIADGIHPNPAGARIVADTVWQALEPLLDDRS